MKKIFILVSFVLLLLHLFTEGVIAQNNKFGVHIAVPSEEDIEKAAELINSNGGEYGYITIVIQDDRRDVSYWQSVFDKLRKLKLIPIIRIATHPEGEVWKTPTEADASSWVEFLQKLNWVTKDRFIILFNEPNHAAEWGGSVDPISFGKVSAAFAKALKSASTDYIIMLAGLDLSAPEARTSYADAYLFLKESKTAFCDSLKTNDQLKCGDYIDAISSHAYPNPGFVGSPYETGRKSIKGYEIEIAWFKELFDGKDYPVYITETGWDSSKLVHATVASYYEYAFNNVWLPDNRVKAVTPFILNYQGQPFLGFSLLELGSLSPKTQFIRMQGMVKIKGQPEIVDKAKIVGNIPNDFVELGRSVVSVNISNIGQAIWGNTSSYSIRVTSSPYVLSGKATLPNQIEPFKSTNIYVPIYSQDVEKDVPGVLTIELIRGETDIVGKIQKTFILHPQPSAHIKATMMSKGLSSGDDFELQVFDKDEKLVYRKNNLKITLGTVEIDELPNVVPGGTYRFVLLKPYYLPRQVMTQVLNGENTVEFDQLLPLDMNNDGALTLGDVQGLFIKRGANDLGIVEKINLFLPFR